MATLYPVVCTCGVEHRVPGTEAGNRLTCSCGKTIDIPDLAKLRMSVGESTRSPELILKAKLNNRELPEERNCLVCFAATLSSIRIQIECEKPYATHSGQLGCLWMVAFGPIWWRILSPLLVDRLTDPDFHGESLEFVVPLRICQNCAKGLTNRQLPELLKKIPIYDKLLAKYPDAKIALC